MKKIVLFLSFMLLSIILYSQPKIKKFSYPYLNNFVKSDIMAYAKNKWKNDSELVRVEYNMQAQSADSFFYYYDNFKCCENYGESSPNNQCLLLLYAYARFSDEYTGWVDWSLAFFYYKASNNGLLQR